MSKVKSKDTKPEKTVRIFLHRLELIPDSALAKKLPRYPRLPATLLGRLARHVDYWGSGFGEVLLLDGLRRSLLAAQTQSGSVAVVVDVKDEEAVQFYWRYGFAWLGNHPLKLYLPIATVARLFI